MRAKKKSKPNRIVTISYVCDRLDPSGVRKTSWVGSHTIETTSRLAIFTTTRDPRDADVTQETHSVMTEQANQSTQNLAARAAEPSGEDRCRLPSRVRRRGGSTALKSD